MVLRVLKPVMLCLVLQARWTVLGLPPCPFRRRVPWYRRTTYSRKKCCTRVYTRKRQWSLAATKLIENQWKCRKKCCTCVYTRKKCCTCVYTRKRQWSLAATKLIENQWKCRKKCCTCVYTRQRDSGLWRQRS